MFDFSTLTESTVSLTAPDGVKYELPRFALSQLAQWAEKRRAEQIAAATAQLSDEKDRARFLTYFQPLPIDVADMILDIGSPAGVRYVLEDCMKRGKVPPDQIEKVLRLGHPADLRRLAEELSGSARSAAAVDALAENKRGEDETPLTEASPT